MKELPIIEIALECINLWNLGRFREAYEKYYSADAVKIEPVSWGEFANEISGPEDMADHEDWLERDWLSVNSVSVSEGPFIGADGFSVIIKTMSGSTSPS